jgi:hypothetical protein
MVEKYRRKQNLYLINNPNDLVGKTIAYTNMALYADYIMIATTDGGILCVSQEISEDDNKQTIVTNKLITEKYLFSNKFMIDILLEKKVVTNKDIENFKEKRINQEKKHIENYKREMEENERKDYERLKAKYEGKEV